MPERIRLSRAKGWRMPPNTVKVDRSTPWGNPFNETQIAVTFMQQVPAPVVYLHTPPSLERCLDLYTAFLYGVLAIQPEYLRRLRGKNLACWCPLDRPCHADVLLRLANP